MSLLALIFSATATVLFVQFLGLDRVSYLDASLMLILGVLIYRGFKWSMIIAMILWTLEKVLAIVQPLQLGSTSTSGTLVMQIVWWAIYMHIFNLAFRVERERARATMPDVGSV
jgi:hypothetical protein